LAGDDRPTGGKSPHRHVMRQRHAHEMPGEEYGHLYVPDDSHQQSGAWRLLRKSEPVPSEAEWIGDQPWKAAELGDEKGAIVREVVCDRDGNQRATEDQTQLA